MVLTPTEEKKAKLRDLACRRKASRWAGYSNIGDFHGGCYECDEHVSPFTKDAGNVDSDLFVMLQDWLSEKDISKPLDPNPAARAEGYTPSANTNTYLQKLLSAHFGGLQIRQIYATNLFPFVKPGHTSAPIPDSVLERAAREFGIPQIDIVRPRLVIVLGVATFRPLIAAAGIKIPWRLLDDAVNNPVDYGSARIWCQSHTGRSGGAAARGGSAVVRNDWTRMADWYYGEGHSTELDDSTPDKPEVDSRLGTGRDRDATTMAAWPLQNSDKPGSAPK